MTLATRRRRRSGGFTLIELLIVVGIIATLASVAVPKYADSLRQAQEGASKGSLGSLRSALAIYYSDNDGNYPNCAVNTNSNVFTSNLIPKYLDRVPPANGGLHPSTNNVYCDYIMVGGSVHDGQGWYYDGASPTDSSFGTIWVACDHTDTLGQSWTSY